MIEGVNVTSKHKKQLVFSHEYILLYPPPLGYITKHTHFNTPYLS